MQMYYPTLSAPRKYESTSVPHCYLCRFLAQLSSNVEYEDCLCVDEITHVVFISVST